MRYEFDTYDAIQKQLPKIGTDILTREGRARVIGQELLAEQLLVETEDHRRILIDASEVLSTIKKGAGQSPAKPKTGKNDDREGRGSKSKPKRKPSKNPAVEHTTEKSSQDRTAGSPETSGKQLSADEGSSSDGKKRKRRRRRPRKGKPRNDGSNDDAGGNPSNKN